MKLLSLILIALFALQAGATDLTKEMDSLGANKALMQKVDALDPDNRVRIVERRDVDRYNRLEIGLTYGMNAGGDSYVNSSIYGGQVDFHFTPHWSIGGRYYGFNNSMTAEGNQVFQDAAVHVAQGDINYHVPQTDFAQSSWLGVINWYPIYGKLALLQSSIAQFDMYLLGGAGQMNLQMGSVPTYTAGAGIGVWLSEHLSTRLEARWQGYRDHLYGGRNLNLTVLSATVGFLL